MGMIDQQPEQFTTGISCTTYYAYFYFLTHTNSLKRETVNVIGNRESAIGNRET
jgi:hypothetical protein